jgi:large subunit ribosomal protein L13
VTAFPQVALMSGRPARADIFTMKTYSPKPEHIDRRWFVLDANGHVLGRVATEVAVLLRGKHKPIFAPHMDTGDHVVVINADKVELTGNKGRDKVAYRHSGYPGGITGVRYEVLLQTRPVAAVEKAVRGMLPKNRLGRQMIKKLHVVAGGEHPHAAQKPIALELGQRPAWEGLPPMEPASGTKSTAPAATERTSSKTRSAGRSSEPSAAASGGAKTGVPAGKKTAAKKTSAKSAGAKNTSAQASRGKASPAKRSTAKKTAAKRSTAKRSTAKKTEER